MATFKDIEKANSTIKTMQISRWDKKKGIEIVKDYAEVNQRIKAFRMLYPEGFIQTEIISHEDGIVIIKATVGYHSEQGAKVILGTGTAFEDKKNGMINGTSYIENCETSAVGRALGMLALGVDVSIASYEEVSNAIAQQQTPKKAPAPKVEQQLICQRCGNVIGTHGKSTAQQVAAATKKNFGKIMCWDCGHAVKEEQEQKAQAVDVTQLAEDAALQLPFPIED